MKNSLLKEKNKTPLRRKFINLVVEQENEVKGLLSDTQEEFGYVISKYSSGDEIRDSNAIISKAKPILAGYVVSLGDTMTDYNKQVATLNGNYAVDTVEAKYEGTMFAKGVQDRVTPYVDTIANNLLGRKQYDDGLSIGGRIKTISDDYLKSVRDLLEVGIRKGLGAKEIAKQIDDLINPNAPGAKSPYDYYRERFGVKVTPLRRSGSISYNSLRIARTEINNTSRLSTIQYYKNQPFCRGFIWHLSAAHPKEDICDAFDGKSFKDDKDMPEVHPQCMCYIVPDLIPASEL